MPALVGLALGLLVLVGLAGPSSAAADLGPSGWAPPTLHLGLPPVVIVLALVTAYVLGAMGVALGSRRERGLLLPGWVVALLGLATLLCLPFGSADHLNYAAYGRIGLQGGDPYTASPIDWAGGADPITSRVEAPWTTTPSIYGPFGTGVQIVAAWIGGDNLRQVVWVWQIIIVGLWLLVRVALRRLTDDHGRVDLLWTANPFVIGLGVLGTHIDLLATAAAVLAVVVAFRRPWLGGVLVGIAVSTKVTYAVAGLALILAWRATDPARWRRAALIGLAGAAAVVIPLHLLAGPAVFAQLARARQSVSLATPWRFVVDLLAIPFPAGGVRTVVGVLAVVVGIVVAIGLARLTAPLAPPTPTGQAMRWLFVLSAAYALAAPYSLPWYDTIIWAALPALAASRLDVLLAARAGVLAIAYVPGRAVGLERGINAAMLMFRRSVGPAVGWVMWAALWRLVRAGRVADPGDRRDSTIGPSSRP